MILCSLLYLLMSWYLEKILPGEYGVPLPFYFPFTRSYWLPASPRVAPTTLPAHAINQLAFEQEPHNLKRTVSIQNLSKVSFPATFPAVN